MYANSHRVRLPNSNLSFQHSFSCKLTELAKNPPTNVKIVSPSIYLHGYAYAFLFLNALSTHVVCTHAHSQTTTPTPDTTEYETSSRWNSRQMPAKATARQIQINMQMHLPQSALPPRQITLVTCMRQWNEIATSSNSNWRARRRLFTQFVCCLHSANSSLTSQSVFATASPYFAA